MTTTKKSGHPKKVSVVLKPVSTPNRSTELSPIDSRRTIAEAHGKRSTKTINVLKAVTAQPTVDIIRVELPESNQAELRAYEIQLKRDIDLSVQQFKAAKEHEIETELNAQRHRVLQQLEAEADDIRRKSAEQGFKDGQIRGESTYSDKIAVLLKEINSVSENKRLFLKDSEPELIKLAVKIAEKILHQHIENNPSAMGPIVDQAIRRITDKDKVIIKVSPEDSDFVRQYREQILETMPDIRTLEIHDEPRMDRGSVLIETRLGYIDSSIHTKLSSIETALTTLYNEL